MNASVFVQSSWAEGMSNSLLQAMSVGCAIVATDVGGTGEALGDAGVLVPPGDDEALGDAIAALISDSKLRAEIGMRAKDRATRFSIGAALDAHRKLYAELGRFNGR